jgi:hypothetical protein
MTQAVFPLTKTGSRPPCGSLIPLNIQHLSMDDQKAAIMKELEIYQGKEKRRDDVSLIGFELPVTDGDIHSYHI